MQVLTSVKNLKVRALRELLTKEGRDHFGAFLIEGEKMAKEAMAANITITDALIERGRTIDPALREGLSKSGANLIEASRNVIEALSDTKTPQGLVCACVRPLPAPMSSSMTRGIILENLRDPGNVGAVIRTADALGIDFVALCGGVELYNPKVVRATMGAIFRQNVITGAGAPQIISELRERGFKIWGAALKDDARPLNLISFSGCCAVVVGNEGAGIEEDTLSLCDEAVIIPMKGTAESLNAAVAAAILMWELSGS